MAVCAQATADECGRECLCKKEVEAEIGKEPAPASALWSMAVRPHVA